MRDAFFDQVYEEAKADRGVIFLAADHTAFALEKYKKDLPDQFINMGISEQNMISVAAGLALKGKKVFAYGIANFASLRCLEQINVDLSEMDLPVNIVITGSGFTYSTDGPTHHWIQDVAAMQAIPNMSIFNCSDHVNSARFAKIATEEKGPKYFRLEKGFLPTLHHKDSDFTSGLERIKDGDDIAIISTGFMTHKCVELAKNLKRYSINAGIIDVYRIKPLNVKKLEKELSATKKVVIVEENILTGGLGSSVISLLSDVGFTRPTLRLSISDQHCIKYGDREWLHQQYGLDVSTMENKILEWLG